MEESLEWVEKLLALMLVRDMQEAPAGDKALALSTAGFSSTEIGDLLGTRPNTIAVQLTRAKRVRKRPTRKKKAARKRR